MRENYARADGPGVVIVFELDSVEQAKRYVANFPMSKAGHAADLGYIPVIATDACGAGNEAAAQRSLDSLRFAGNAVMTDTDTISKIFRRQPMKSR